MKTLAKLTDFGRVGSRKFIYIIVLTSVFWFSMNVLLLIANNQSARESLERLTITSNRRLDSHYMKHVNIQPLAPAHKHKHFNLPWLNADFWNKRITRDITEKLLFQPGDRTVYDISSKLNLHPGKGEGGIASYLDTEEDKKYAESIFTNHSFNSFLSDKISLDRTMKDFRGQE